MSTPIRLVPGSDSADPPRRGRLLTAQEVADIIGDRSPAWVRRTVPHKVALGHSTVRWFEQDVREWLDQCRD